MKKLLFVPILFWSVIAWNQDNNMIIAEDVITESSNPFEDQFIDGIVQKRLIVENRVLPYEPIREADVPWEKRIWRVINTREKINLPFAYPDKPFFDILKDAATNGEISVFEDEEFQTMLSVEALEKKLYQVDTVAVQDPETFEFTYEVTRSEFNALEVERYRLKEVWFFDKESSRMKVRLLGIAPIRDVVDPTTKQFKYQEVLFWVYYPQAREVLSKHRVFNAYNDAAPMTWDVLFEDRMFSSYIYKETNVLDQRLEDYLAGVDILLESEKIKNKLLNFEVDLWEH